MSFSISSKTQIQFNNQEYRCPKCSLIPFIQIINEDNKILMETKCLNNHIYSKPFDEMQKLCKFSPISNCICDLCEEKDKKIYLIFFTIVQFVINFFVLNMEIYIN